MTEHQDGKTTLPVMMSTRDRLKEEGKKNESWDALINRLINERHQIIKK